MADKYDEIYILDTENALQTLLTIDGFSNHADEQFRQYLAEQAGKHKKVAVYCNYTAGDPDPETTLRSGKTYCQKLADKISGWEYAGAYLDIAYHFRNPFEERPAFEELIADARSGKFDLIVTTDIDRFTESTEETLSITEELRLLPHPVLVMFEKNGTNSEALHRFLQIMGYPEYYRKCWRGLSRMKRKRRSHIG